MPRARCRGPKGSAAQLHEPPRQGLRVALRLTASLDPAPEHGDALDRPCTVAGHVAALGCGEDRLRILLHSLVVPEVEQEGHRPSITLAEEWLDIDCEVGRRC